MSEHGHSKQVGAYRGDDGRDDIGLDIAVKDTNTMPDALPVCESSHGRVVKVVKGPSSLRNERPETQAIK